MRALPRSGQRIEYSTFPKRVNVERDRSAFARYCPTHHGEGVIVIEVLERRDLSADEFVFAHGLAPLSLLVIDPNIHVRRKGLGILPVVGVEDAAYTPVCRMLGNHTFERCQKHCILDDKARVAMILV